VSARTTITLPDGQEVALRLEAGEALDQALSRHGLDLNTRCGRRGLCRGCEVVVEAGEVVEAGRERGAGETVRSCQCFLDTVAGLRLRLPARSLMAHPPVVAEDFKLRVPVGANPLEPIDEGRVYGLAVDVGTTTVAVLLADLRTGEILGRSSALNAQARYGDNVLTRIDYALSGEGNLARLREAVVGGTITGAIRTVLAEAGVAGEAVAAMAVAGNTAMLHLLVGADPGPLATVPFRARFLEHRRLRGSELGEAFALPGVAVHLLPGLAAYVGADIGAGAFCTGMRYEPGPTLLIDVGTNGEILLQAGGKLRACATAAGPAFEGSGLTHGCRAAKGAVSTIELREGGAEAVLGVIGNVPAERAVGLCGSAYIDFLAQGRTSGLLTEMGRFAAGAWEALPAQRRGEDAYGRVYRLDARLSVSEADIATLQQAKAAIGAGVEVLLGDAGIEPEELERLYLAGGFGMHVNAVHARQCGLLPGVTDARLEVVGNTSLGGAYLALLDKGALAEMEALRGAVEIVELNRHPRFEDTLIDHMALP
jgi:uncharacterized 2Fe-2S/4Fe-4S cluster protein (DUF4445 family)